MLGSLPGTVDPILLAEKNTRLVGRLAVRGMSRLRVLLANDSGQVEVDLVFELAERSNLPRMHGRLAVAVNATCQRCLEPVSINLAAEPDMILLRQGEPEGSFPLEADMLTCGQKPVMLAELVEDELLLAMPMVPMHPLGECPARRYLAGGVKGAATENPFAELARPKHDRD